MSQEFTLFEQRLMEAGYERETINQILEVAKNSIYPKKYGLVWEEKEEKIKENLKLNLPYLEEIKEREIKLGGLNSPQHLLIEGDNYEALKLLQATHKGMVDVIYIDPPYNTGKEFIYNDKLVDKEDDYRHSQWLSFMYKRLLLAEKLMARYGIIFISIDDNEMAQLKLLCDEIFGEKNFVSIMPRKTVEHIRKTANHELQNLHDYVLLYTKDKENTVFSKEYIGDKEYPHRDEKGNYLIKPFQNSGENGTREARPNLYYPIYHNKDTGLLSLEEAPNSIEILPRKVKGKDGRWLWSKEKFLKDNNKLTVFKGNIYKKEYEWESSDQGKYRSFKTWLDLYPNRTGSVVLNNLNLGDRFSYPKPLDLIKFLINLKKDDDLIILDFFAGSGTTGHAVLDLNKENNKKHQFILCTNNENNICEEVTYERLKRVINGYTTPKGKEVGGIPSNLKYLKVQMVEKDTYTEEDLSYLYMPHVLPLLQLKHNAFSLVAQSEGAVVYEKEGFRFGVASDLVVESDLKLLSQQLKGFEGEKVLYLFSTDTHSYPKYQQLAELDGIIQPIPREILNLLKGE